MRDLWDVVDQLDKLVTIYFETPEVEVLT